ncbi:unnamed protein product [Blepharisma stoltei]|uniref:UDENN domain-containing protein n=1 Tax=Blepharisma stoltei TaxID=1481888 RepID=A0AAU9IEY4_9CILI|nr:unnamed protein product [Blepharisma stoltei]
MEGDRKEYWKNKYRQLSREYHQLENEHNLLKQNYELSLQGRLQDAEQIKSLRRETKKLKKMLRNSQELSPPELSSQAINDFAKTIFTRRPNINSLFSTLRGEDHNSPISSPSGLTPIHKMSDKPSPANADEGIADAYSDPGIYEAFFLVGVTKSDLGNPNVKPSILFEYPEESSSISDAIRHVIPDFCFPSQIEMTQLTFAKSSEYASILFSQASNRRPNCYIFTLRSEEYEDIDVWRGIPNYSKDALYILCVQIDDIEMGENNELGWLVPKCYCIASYIPIFELHFEILFSLLKLKGMSRSENPIESLPLICENEVELLRYYWECDEIHPGKEISIQVGLIEIWYCCGDLSTIDVPWLCIPLFSSLTLQDFLWLIFALAQEKSIVFVSENLGLVTSCVLGALAMLRPLKWSNVTIPILPDSLVELLDSPVPIITGIQNISWRIRHDLVNTIFVMLDEPKINQRVQGGRTVVHDVIEPQALELRNTIKDTYKCFENNKYIFNPKEAQKEASLEIYQSFNLFWSEIINNSLDSSDPKEQLESLKAVFPKGDWNFLELITKTQMFINYFQNNY